MDDVKTLQAKLRIAYWMGNIYTAAIPVVLAFIHEPTGHAMLLIALMFVALIELKHEHALNRQLTILQTVLQQQPSPSEDRPQPDQSPPSSHNN